MKRHKRAPADAGLQPERTELSWRRTLLALVVASVASARTLYPLLGGSAVIFAMSGLMVAAGLMIVTRRRFARMHPWFNQRLRGTDATPLKAAACSGRAMLAMSAFVSTGCALVLVQLALVH